MRSPCLALLLCCLAGSAVADPPIREGGPGILQTLENKRVSLDVKDAEAKAVFDALSKQTGVAWRLGSGSADALEDLVVPSLWLRKMPGTDAVALLCKMLRLSHKVDGKGILVGSRDDYEMRGRAVPRVYPVGGLLARAPGGLRPLPSLEMPAAKLNVPTIGGAQIETPSVEDLVELIRERVSPESWEDEGRMISVLAGDRLLISTTPELHGQLAGLLRSLTRERLQPIVLHAWWVDPSLAKQPMSLARWRGMDVERGAAMRASGVSGQVLSLAAGERKALAIGEKVRMLQTGGILHLQPHLGVDRDGEATVRVTVHAQHSALQDSGRLELTRGRFTTRLKPGTVTPVMLAGYGKVAKALMLCVEVPIRAEAKRRQPPVHARNARVRRVLAKQKVSIDHRDAPLSDVLREFTKEVGVDIVLDPEVIQERTAEELKVQLRVKQLALGEVLNLILQLKQLGMLVEHGVIYVTNRENVYNLVERRYRVHDLTHRAPHFGAPIDPDEEESESLSMDMLSTLLLETVAPDSWDDMNYIRQSIMQDGVLRVGNTESIQLRVAALIDALRAGRPTLVTRLQLIKDRSGVLADPAKDRALARLPFAERLRTLLKTGAAQLEGHASIDAQSGQQVTLFSGAQRRRGEAIDKHGLSLTVTPKLLGAGVRLDLKLDASSRLRQNSAQALRFDQPTIVASGGGYTLIATVSRR